jgi:DNA-binding protein H-NS
MSSYKELLAQREKLEKQIEEAKSREYAEVLNEIKQKMADYGITLTELGGGRGKNAESGSTWSGRGKPPRWIAGQDREKFLIAR